MTMIDEQKTYSYDDNSVAVVIGSGASSTGN